MGGRSRHGPNSLSRIGRLTASKDSKRKSLENTRHRIFPNSAATTTTRGGGGGLIVT